LAPIQLPDLLGLSSVLPPDGLRHVFVTPHLALILCQTVLLALWGIYSGASLWVRAAGLVAGAACLEALASTAGVSGVSTMTLAVISAALLVVRALGVQFSRETDLRQLARAETEGLRFSIRDLMVLVAAIALLSAVTRGLHGSPLAHFLVTAVWAMCFVALGLAALWAGLGIACPRARGIAVVGLSLVVGPVFALATHVLPSGFVYIVLAMLLYPALLLGSLLVVRSCGYRFVRRAAYLSGPTDGGADGRSPLQVPHD
jgi:hypothetical protein